MSSVSIWRDGSMIIQTNILSWPSWRAQDKRQWTGLDVIPNIVGSENFLTWKIFYVVARWDIGFVFEERGWWVEWKVVQNLWSHRVGCVGWALSQVRNEDFQWWQVGPLNGIWSLLGTFGLKTQKSGPFLPEKSLFQWFGPFFKNLNCKKIRKKL